MFCSVLFQVQKHEALRIEILENGVGESEEDAANEGVRLHQFNEWLSSKLPRLRRVRFTIARYCSKI